MGVGICRTFGARLVTEDCFYPYRLEPVEVSEELAIAQMRTHYTGKS